MSETRTTKIERALKRLDGIPARMVYRAGRVVSIPAQKIELEARDGIQITVTVVEDVGEE